MPNREGTLRGNVNLILNGLIRDGVIASFATSFGEGKSSTRPVRITVVAPSANSPEAVKHAVMTALDRFSQEVSVTVKAG